MKKCIFLLILLLCGIVFAEDYCSECFPNGTPQYAYVVFCGIELTQPALAPPNGQVFMVEFRPSSPQGYPPCCFTYEYNPDGWSVWLTMNNINKYLYLVRDGGFQRYFGQDAGVPRDCNLIWENELDYNSPARPYIKGKNGVAFVFMSSPPPIGLCSDLNFDGIVNFVDYAVLADKCGGNTFLGAVALLTENWLNEE